MKTINIFLVLSILLSVSCSKENSDSYGNLESGSGGRGGSMARFTLSGDMLYIVSDNELKLFDVSTPDKPFYMQSRNQMLDFGVETIFPMDDFLFIGSQNGMYIYDITRPAFPRRLSHTVHITACDPVAAQGNYAYVTLNGSNDWCGRTSNILQIYDIGDPTDPILVNTVEGMTSPRGLDVDGDKLLVCDNGLKMYDISTPDNPIWISDLADVREMRNVDGYDVIMMNGTALLIGNDGLYALDYTGESLKFISKLEVNND